MSILPCLVCVLLIPGLLRAPEIKHLPEGEPSLVHYWVFDATSVENGIVRDLVGNAHGRIEGDVTFPNEDGEEGLVFDGEWRILIDEGLRLSDDPITIELMVEVTGSCDQRQEIMRLGNPERQQEGFVLWVGEGPLRTRPTEDLLPKLQFDLATAGIYGDNPRVSSVQDFHSNHVVRHLAITYLQRDPNSSMNLSIDGMPINSISESVEVWTDVIGDLVDHIGPAGAIVYPEEPVLIIGESLKGRLRYLRIYNRQLDYDEIHTQFINHVEPMPGYAIRSLPDRAMEGVPFEVEIMLQVDEPGLYEMREFVPEYWKIVSSNDAEIDGRALSWDRDLDIGTHRFTYTVMAERGAKRFFGGTVNRKLIYGSSYINTFIRKGPLHEPIELAIAFFGSMILLWFMVRLRMITHTQKA